MAQKQDFEVFTGGGFEVCSAERPGACPSKGERLRREEEEGKRFGQSFAGGEAVPSGGGISLTTVY